MNNTTAITVTGTQKFIPKPTKTEIIEAMVVRAKVKHDEENLVRKKNRELLRKKIEKEAIKEFKKQPPNVSIYTYSDKNRNHCNVRFENVVNPEIIKLCSEFEEYRQIFWDEKEVRKSIRQELSGIGKKSPTRLLEDPETVKAIDAKLSEWGI